MNLSFVAGSGEEANWHDPSSQRLHFWRVRKMERMSKYASLGYRNPHQNQLWVYGLALFAQAFALTMKAGLSITVDYVRALHVTCSTIHASHISMFK